MQIERVANTEPVSIDIPAVSDISKASVKGARQLTVCDTSTFHSWGRSVLVSNHKLWICPHIIAVAGLHKGMVSICARDQQKAATGKAGAGGEEHR